MTSILYRSPPEAESLRQWLEERTMEDAAYTEDEVEAVARAIRENVACYPECQLNTETTPTCRCHKFAACSAIEAFLRARSSAG